MYTQYTIFIIKMTITPEYSKSAAIGFFLGSQERVRNSHGKRAISVRATEVLLYLGLDIIIKLKFTTNFDRCMILNVLNCLTNNFGS